MESQRLKYISRPEVMMKALDPIQLRGATLISNSNRLEVSFDPLQRDEDETCKGARY